MNKDQKKKKKGKYMINILHYSSNNFFKNMFNHRKLKL